MARYLPSHISLYLTFFYLFSCIFKIYCVPLYPYLLYFNFFFSILESSREYKQ